MPTVSLAESYLSVGGDTEPQETRDAMNDNRYRKIFEDLTRDLFAVARKHGKRALHEAVRDAAKGELLQEDNLPPDETELPDEGVLVIPVSSDAEEEIGETEEEKTTEEESADEPEDTPPEDLEYPDEDVWTLPPPPDEREEEEGGSEDGQSADEGHELSDAAEKVAAELAERLEKRMRK